jgi:hypothetical protein
MFDYLNVRIIVRCSWYAKTYSVEQNFLEKIIVAQIVHIFLVFYGQRKIITAFTRARHWATSWAWWVQLTSSNPIKIHLNNILQFTSIFSKWSLPFRYSIKILYTFPFSLRAKPSHFYHPPRINLPENMRQIVGFHLILLSCTVLHCLCNKEINNGRYRFQYFRDKVITCI